jgi:hypothetical protein
MKGLIDGAHKRLLEILLDDETIKRALIDDKKLEYYKRCDINNDGSITFGKTSYRWVNRLFGDEETKSFVDVCMSIIAALSGQKNNVNEILLRGLTRETIVNAVMDKKLEEMVDRLFDAARYGNCSDLQTKGMTLDTDIREKVKVNSCDGYRTVYLPGSGDPLMRIKIGVKGVEWCGD